MPTNVPTVHVVPHDRLQVELVRCGVNETHLLSDWCDGALGRDYFFKRRHLESILARDTNAVYAITVNRHFGGMTIVYRNAVLDNLYIAPEYRELGVGSAVLDFIRPVRIRSKTNMLAGDPTPFYERNGYVRDVPDPERPHIIDMVRGTEPPNGAQSGRSPGPIENGRPTAERAVGVASSGSVAVASIGAVATPAPLVPSVNGHGDAHVLPNGFVALPVAEFNELRTLQKNRDRVRKYRARRRAEHAATDAATAGGVPGFGPAALNGNGAVHPTAHFNPFAQ